MANLQSFERGEYQQVKADLHRKILDRLDLEKLGRSQGDSARDEVLVVIRNAVNAEVVPLSFAEREKLSREILDEIFGLGPLEPLLKDPSVSDILVNRFDRVYIERAGKLELTGLSFKDNGHLMQIIDRIVSRVGRRIDESSPMVDARLADGSRVNAIIPPLAIDGACLSIRRFGRDPITARQMIENKSLTEPMLELLSAMVKGRLNLLISGGTGAGKTTVLNVLSGYIPNNERIVTIEDAAELQMKQEHVVRLETRPPNIEGKGAIRQRQLVINSLRMRPDRIVLGEVRGEEAFDMLQAMNTGHDGSLTTEPSWPVFIACSMSKASSPRTSPSTMRSGRIRRLLMTSCRWRIAPLPSMLGGRVSRRTTCSCFICNSAASSMVTMRSLLGMYPERTFSTVVLPAPVPPEISRLSRPLTMAESSSSIGSVR